MSNQSYVLALDRQTQIIFTKRIYVEIAGSLHAGVLLSRILWWYQPSEESPEFPHKLRRNIKGVWWLVKKRTDWWKECCLTEYEYDGAIKRLQALKIVVAEIHLDWDGKTKTHLRVDFDVLRKMIDAHLSELENTQFPESDNVQFQNEEISNSGIGQLPIPYSNKNTYTKNTTENIKGFSDAKTTPTPYPLSEVQIGKAKGKIEIKKFNKLGLGKPAPLGENMVTATDVLAKHSQKKLEALQAVPQATGVSVLATRWKQHSGAVGGFAKALTGKESGQLKHLLKGAGPQAIPVIDYAWGYWDKFCSKAKSAKDLDHAPSQPHIGFLVAHYELILQLIAKSKEASAASMQQQIDKPPLVVDNPVKVSELKPTVDAIADDLAYFQQLKKE